MAHLLIFGLGYSAKRVRAATEALGWRVTATGQDGELDFADRQGVVSALGHATHVLSSVPPVAESDLVLDRYGEALAEFAERGGRMGYLSSTGVYGDCGGAWVDETAPVGHGRRSARVLCDRQWLERGARVFRLPGIYGLGRSPLERVLRGTAHRVDVPGQVFSRIHVDDLAAGGVAAFDAPPGAYNLADDLPASQSTVIEEACRLLRILPPPLQTLEEAGLSPQARAFYAENRRVANGKARRVLGWRPRYPTYREGLLSVLRRTSL